MFADKFVEMPAPRLERRDDGRRQFDKHPVGLGRGHEREAQRAQSRRERLRLQRNKERRDSQLAAKARRSSRKTGS